MHRSSPHPVFLRAARGLLPRGSCILAVELSPGTRAEVWEDAASCGLCSAAPSQWVLLQVRLGLRATLLVLVSGSLPPFSKDPASARGCLAASAVCSSLPCLGCCCCFCFLLGQRVFCIAFAFAGSLLALPLPGAASGIGGSGAASSRGGLWSGSL